MYVLQLQSHQQQQQQVHHQQQQQPSTAPEVTGTIGIDSSSAAEEVASSPECVGIDEEEDALSLSPNAGGGVGGGGTSPTPAKRQCLQQDGVDTSHQRSHTSTSSSDLRHEIEAATKDNPVEIVEVSFHYRYVSSHLYNDYYKLKFHIFKTSIFSIELPNYYTRLQMAVACGLGLLAGQLPGLHTDAAPKHSLCYFSSVSE